jgi:hypothetical protein
VRGGLEARVAVARSRQSIRSATSDESAVRHGCCARFPIQEAVDYSVDCELPTPVAHIATDNAVKICSRPFFKDEISPDDSVQDQMTAAFDGDISKNHTVSVQGKLVGNVDVTFYHAML